MSRLSEMQVQPFEALLRHWRQQRGWSQLELACQSEVSQRHISFLESGRWRSLPGRESQPSRVMVLHLATVLAVPLHQQNVMLTGSGFAPVYSEHDLSAPELAPIQQAIAAMLRQQEAQGEGEDSPTAQLLRSLEADLPAPAAASLPFGSALPVLPVTFVKASQRLRFFTIISTLGTPRDITLQELHIESLFPADAVTTELMRTI